ncbi:phosphatidylinositol N-acetylglucosaminyltransferase subunit A, putative [Plasmodium chabaudi adami]|uniref:Phosphatidylinositol N-acetylglucosaminyltransferase subunit A, putative n=1 Tax=Plasmodium chabaudi adami TaxID=5826 RepID=A0A1D3LHI3_PLACE|nr:phosphatidylinositol N-acetylglucosaminyltransferase subunit A, putative [Plasmodium chabaudi adami]
MEFENNDETKEGVKQIYKKERKCCICMVCDFFYPNMGGIEIHIFELSKELIKRGFKVIVVTHCYGNRHGVRWMGNGIKVYYLPLQVMTDAVTFPNFIGVLPLCRNIIFREKVDIVHGHQAGSPLTQQFILHAKTLGVKTVYTDHSLYSFSESGCLHLNKLLRHCVHDVDHSICVSHANRENFILRTQVNPYKTSVISNAIDSTKFVPCINKRPASPKINIIIISRLTYRKGVTLIAKVIPLVHQKYPFINFIIGGDGPKRIILEEMREKYRLHNSVILLGKIKQEEVQSILQTGHIFLNASLTEAFCIAIIEAASSGLLVVSTNVGGTSEVLPPDMIILAKPDPIELSKAVDQALLKLKDVDVNLFHDRLSKMYSWKKVAEKTEKVYMTVMSYSNETLLNRIQTMYDNNTFFSKICIFLIMVSHIYCKILEWIVPRKSIEEAISFPHLIEDE